MGCLHLLSPNHRYHLFLSATCPHCQTVLAALERLPECTVAINPISEEVPAIPGLKLEKRQDYSSEANLLLLALLDIREIPALLELTGNQYVLYKGEKRILQILQAQCGSLPPAVSGGGQTYEGMSTPLDGQEEGECTIEEACPQ